MPASKFQYDGPWKMLRPRPTSPGLGNVNASALAKNTGPTTPSLLCSCATGSVAPGFSAARDCDELFAVNTPDRTLNGSPDW